MGRGSLEEDTNHILVLSDQRHLFLYFCISFYTSVLLLFLSHRYILCRISQVAQLVESACSVGETGSNPGCEDSLKKDGNPFQYSCLGNSTHRAWGALVHRGAKSRTWLKPLSTHTYIYFLFQKEKSIQINF